MADPDKPPWVVEAQAFIDREWRRHVHAAVHLSRPDWQGRHIRMMNSDGVIVIDEWTCRYCEHGDFESALIESARAAVWDTNSPAAALPIMLTTPHRMDDHESTE